MRRSATAASAGLPRAIWTARPRWGKDLPEDEQEIMTEAAQLATEYAREQSDARIADKIATIEESGTEIITLSDKTRKEIREASKDVYESIREVIDPKIYDSYMERIEK